MCAEAHGNSLAECRRLRYKARNRGLTRVGELTTLNCFNGSLIAQVEERLAEFFAEVHPALFSVLRRREFTPGVILADENEAIVIEIALPELDILPSQREQFSEPQTRTERGEKERIPFWP